MPGLTLLACGPALRSLLLMRQGQGFLTHRLGSEVQEDGSGLSEGGGRTEGFPRDEDKAGRFCRRGAQASAASQWEERECGSHLGVELAAPGRG